MVPKVAKWYRRVPNDTERCPNGSQWYRIVSNGTKRWGMVPNGVEGCRVEPKSDKWCGIVGNRMDELVLNRVRIHLIVEDWRKRAKTGTDN